MTKSLTSAMIAYDNLLRDPCAASFAHPPYSGLDTGYLLRVTQSYFLTAAGTFTGGTKVNGLNCFFQIQPSTYPAVLGCGTTAATANVAYYTYSSTPFLATGTVRQYRPVAACLKFVPIGPIADRSGIVGMGYCNGPLLTTGSVASFGDTLNQCLERAPNGSSEHEIRWLPNASDERFDPYTGGFTDPEASCLIFSITNCDGVATSTANANLNGYLEYTAVYEWLPAQGASLTSAPKTPLPFTTQQHQATISDLGAYLLHGVRRTASVAAEGMVRGAVGTVLQSISSLSSSRRYSPGVPLVTM